ncbi:MAG: transglycosylase domain-containing protein [Dysgonamonadaceae bacterium]|nr:transglycosylase domain-containing protein [Dysgonamonadaceae bacterium]
MNKKNTTKAHPEGKTKKQQSAKNGFIVKWIWRIFGICIVAILFVFLLISTGVIGYLPPINELENPIDKYASQVISSDDKLLFTYSDDKENRIFVDYSDLSPYLVQALVATEDQRFYGHSGIDAIGLARAIVKTMILQNSDGGGGSTITQQLAKQLYTNKGKRRAKNKMQRIFQKPVEWVIAVQLERQYTKEEIINLYLNEYDFNYSAIGIESAAHTYFGVAPKDLKVEEAAMLVGMLKNAALYNPVRRAELTKKRRDVVLAQMRKAGHLTKQQTDSLKQMPIKLKFHRLEHVDIPAPYYRQYLGIIMMAKKPERKNYPEQWQQQQFIEDSLAWKNNPLYGWCNKHKKTDGSNYNIYTDGLKIYATIDSRMQKYAEDAVTEHLGGYLQPLFEKEKAGRAYAPFSSDVKNRVEELMTNAMRQTDRYRLAKKAGKKEGEILNEFKNKKYDMKVFSWKMGEVDTIMTPWDSIRYHKSFLRTGLMAMSPVTGHVKAYVGGPNFRFFKYDMVSTGKRQIGSTIKPFLYSLAMEEGMTPCDQLIHEAQTLILETGEPWTPDNPGASRVGEEVTIKWGLQVSSNWVTVFLMKQFSPYAFVRLLKSFGLKNNIPPVVSLCLGSCEASVSEMTSGYTTFANRGIRIDPVLVTRIENSYGDVLDSFSPNVSEIFGENTNYKMLDMLRGVIDGGTGNRLRRNYNLKGQMGGKTGTSQENSDGWFMSFTPDIVVGCWVGGEDRSVHFDRMDYGQGASMALPIQGLFYQKIYADSSLNMKDDGEFESGNPCAGGGFFFQDEDDSLEGIDDLFQ